MPVGRICGRPITQFLVRNGRRYGLADKSGNRLSKPFVAPRTARLNQTLLALYVERMVPCVRYVEQHEHFELIDDPESRLSFHDRGLENAVRNFRLVGNALASPEGDALLVSLLLSRIRPDLIDSKKLYEQILSETVARGVGSSKILVH